MKTHMKSLTVTLLIAGSAFAQGGAGNVGGPLLGVVFDREIGGIRPLIGVPGSSLLGKPLDGAVGLRDATAERDYALAVDANGAAVLVSPEGSRPLPGAGTGATRLIFSPRGSAAALYFADSGTAQIFTGLPDTPRVSRTVDLEGAFVRLAVSDDGATLLSASPAGRDGSIVYAYTAGQSPRILHRARLVSALAFVPGTADVVIAERNAVKLISPSFGVQTVSDAGADVIALAATEQGAKVFMATRDGRILIHDRSSSTEVSLSCGCAPTAFSAVRGNAVFRLNEMGNGPLWMLDADSAEPRILFVAPPAGGSR